jgi:hypothetical protein
MKPLQELALLFLKLGASPWMIFSLAVTILCAQNVKSTWAVMGSSLLGRLASVTGT